MGSSPLGEKSIDATVGGLVWVRRRNGSWWPGQIIDIHECSESFMASPKLGTPIKLLGRDDASVDWYNLDKSKRVKPFRCGEYDDCIEKAKRAAASLSKKVVKYARRDDAILHALEIEWEQLNGECNPVKDSPALSLSSKDSERTEDEVQDLIEDRNLVLNSSMRRHVQARPRRTPNDSEDDGTEGVVKRMRGLDDLGLGEVLPLKRKRSQVAHVHEFLKKKSRHRPLTKVLESTAMIDVPVISEKFPSSSEFISNESNRRSSVVNHSDSIMAVPFENRVVGNALERASEPFVVGCKHKENGIHRTSAMPENRSSERIFDVPFMGRSMQHTGNPPKFSSQKPQVGSGRQSSQSSLVETLSLGNEELNESVSTSSGAADVDSVTRKGSSKWQSKGKRNSRNSAKNKKQISRITVDYDDDDLNDNLDEYWGWSSRSSKIAPSRGPLAESKLFSDGSFSTQRSLPYRQSRFVMNPRYGPEFSLGHHNTTCDSTLYDTPLVVKASSRPQHVPYISLMSKLTGQPIVGHPITVEVLEEGAIDHLISGAIRDLPSRGSEINNGLRENMYVSNYAPNPKSGGGRVPSKHLKSHRVSSAKSTKLKKSGPSSKKIRKLSSLTGLNRLSAGERSLVVEKIMGPVVACVPLKVVFSRINASLQKGLMRPPKRVIRLKKA